MAARFPDREHASQALESLQDRLDNGLDAEIAPLATTGPSSPSEAASDTLLAGHFAEEQAPEVVEIVQASGGEIVADVDERWTRPRYRPGAAETEVSSGFRY